MTRRVTSSAWSGLPATCASADAGLSVESRNSAMATIFGSDAVRAAAVPYDNGADGVRRGLCGR